MVDSERLYKKMFDDAPRAIIIADSDQRVVAANQRAKSLFNRSGEDAAGLSLDVFLPEFQPDGRAAKALIAEMAKDALETGQTELTAQCRPLGEEPFPARIKARSLDLGDETLTQYVFTRLPGARGENHAPWPAGFYKDALDALEDGILAADGAGRTLFWNKSFSSMWNAPSHVPPGGPITEAFDMIAAFVDDDAPETLNPAHGPLGRNGENPVVLALKDGRIIEQRSHALRSESETGFTLWRFCDVTAARSRESDLEATTRKLTDIIEFLPEPTMVVDERGVIVVWNKAIEDVSGMKKGDIIGKGNYEYALPFYNERRPILIDWALSDDGVPIEKYTLVQKKGEMLYGEIYTPNAFGGKGAYLWGVAAPLKDDSGKIVGAVECMRNVTERKMVEQELERAKHAAETATKAKSEFLARMSHEIRTPMNSILGMCELLSETELDYDQMDYVQTLHSSGEMLLAIINDILDFSKIEAGQVELERVPFDLIDLVEGIGRILGVKAHEKGLELVCRVSPDVHRYVLGDPTRLKQVLINLLSNAIKFTEKGDVTLHILPGPDPDDKETIRLTVSDTGIGIQKEKQAAVFESFSQADTSTTRKFGGTGLGLAISKKLVELMGGEIGIESEEGVGTTFVITARFERTERAPGFFPFDSDILKMLSGVKALVVDDNSTNRLLLHDHLTRWGALVALADNGPAALSTIDAAAASGAPFDIIFLDMLMPGMDGMEAARRIKKLYPQAPPHVIINTSSDMYENRIEAKELKLDGFLPKPVKRSDLMYLFSKILEHDEHPAHVENDHNPAGNLLGLRLLLVEDIPANRKVVQQFLKKTGIDVTTAVNGKAAVDAYTRENGNFDIVLMDREMPVMDGLAATRKIREFEQARGLAATSIVALTAHAFTQHKEECLQAGCDEFLSKPIKKKELLKTLDRIAASISHPQAEDEEIAQDAQPGNGDETQPESADHVVVAIDEDLEELVSEFLEELAEAMESMARALLHEDFKELRRLAHGFKGAAANFEMPALADIYSELEIAAQNIDIQKSKETIKKASDFLTRVKITFVAA